VVNALSAITCNGQPALRYASMSGVGVAAPFMSSWSSFYDSATTALQIQYSSAATGALFIIIPSPRCSLGSSFLTLLVASVLEGLNQMQAGNIDFGVSVLRGVSPTNQRRATSDLQYLCVPRIPRRAFLWILFVIYVHFFSKCSPIAGFALSLGYRIPELDGQPPLALDLYTVSLFYTGNITKWNDPRIQLCVTFRILIRGSLSSIKFVSTWAVPTLA
jgi:hypothetical protein